MSNELDIDHLRSWIGKQDHESDIITPALAKRLRATLDGYTQFGTEAASSLPLGVHWCLAAPAVTRDGLGVDGHPAKGGFLPPVPLPRRMWASSHVRFHKKPRVGAPIARTSTIADIVLKQSASSGPLAFVQIDHAYAQDNETIIEDEQTVVYRQPSAFKQGEPHESQTPQQKPALTLNVIPDSTLLFRYSALTFNGHRIHYDHNYATSQESYPALVVQGPLTATLLMNLAQASRPNNPLREFEFRAVAPAFVDQAMQLCVSDDGATLDSKNMIEARNHLGSLIMTASAQFGERISSSRD